MVNWAQFTLFLYILARMTGLVFFNPILGRRTFPAFFRIGLVLVLTVCVISTAGQAAAVPARNKAVGASPDVQDKRRTVLF